MTTSPVTLAGVFCFHPAVLFTQGGAVNTGQGDRAPGASLSMARCTMEQTMKAVNPVRYIGCPRGYPSQSPMAPDEPSMPTTRPADYDPGATVHPDIPVTWKMTAAALADAQAQLAALTPIAHLFKDQIASLKQLLARHDAYVKMETDEAANQVPRIRAAQAVTEAIRLAQAQGIDWQGALDDFLSAISEAAGQ